MNYCALCLFCEDIRQEQGSQETLIGILPNNINVQSLPGMMPKLGVYVRYHFSIDYRPKSVQSFFLDTEENEILKMGIDESLLSETFSSSKRLNQPILGFMSRAVTAPFVFNHEGLYKVITDVDGEQFVAGILDIRVQK